MRTSTIRLLTGPAKWFDGISIYSSWQDPALFGLTCDEIAEAPELDRETCFCMIAPAVSLAAPHHRVLDQVVHAFTRAGWQVALMPGNIPVRDFLVRHRQGAIWYPSALADMPVYGQWKESEDIENIADNLRVVAVTQEIPIDTWQSAYADAASDSSQIAAVEFASNKLLRSLASTPDLMFALSPRMFEEFIAELLVRDGAQVTLTPERRDFGRDILALYTTPFGRHLYLVECKRYAKNRPVGISVVRALYGVTMSERATAGMLVTSSSFTRGARRFQDTVTHQLQLRDYNFIVEWLRKHIQWTA